MMILSLFVQKKFHFLRYFSIKMFFKPGMNPCALCIPECYGYGSLDIVFIFHDYVRTQTFNTVLTCSKEFRENLSPLSFS